MTVIRDVLVKITTDNSGLSKGLDEAKGALKGFAVAAGVALAGATAAFGALTAAALQSAKEIDRFAKVSNTSAQEFQRWAAAAKTAGFESEKVADILKDVNDRVGDFMATGGGPMADFFENVAPKVGVTAEQFRKLSGPQALQLYVDTLQKAGASQQDFTFYLEAMAGDATLLLPLLRDNGAELNRLADAAARAGGILSDETLTALREANNSVTQIQQSFEGFTNELIAAVAPALADAAAAFADMAGEGGPIADAIDRIAASFAGLAQIMASPQFIGAATTALTVIIDLTAMAAEGVLLLANNVEIATGVFAALAIAVAALGGPISVIAGLAAAAGVGIYSIATASGAAEAAAGGFSGAIADNAVKLVTMANASKAAREELAKLIALQGGQAAAAAETVGVALDREIEALQTAEREWNGRAAGIFERAPDLEEMRGKINGLKTEYIDAVDASKRLIEQQRIAEELAAQGDSGGVVIPETGIPGGGGGGSGGGGGGGENDLSKRIESLIDELATEREILAEWYQERQDTLAEALAARQITEEEYRAARERLEQEHADRLGAIDEAAMAAKLDAARTILGGLATLMSSENKKLFRIGQAAALAQATVDGFAAAQAAWKHGMVAGGPPLAAAYTAASLVRTGANIAAIASQSPNGSGSTIAAVGGGASSTPTAAAPGPLEVRLTGGLDPNTLYTGRQIGSLLDALTQEAGDRGFRFMVAR